MSNSLSIVLPIYNEAEGIPELFLEMNKALVKYSYEIIAVNDGSSENSLDVLKKFASKESKLKIINFKKNYGQTAAISAGVQYASGDIIVLMDSDLENLPSDIPLLIKKLDDGYDVVSGWRRARWQGQFLTRKLPSLLANSLISKVSGVKLHDYGCTLKVYKKEVLADVRLYGQMHRFIPVYCKWEGGSVAELPVSYKPRKYGKSNYGLFRVYKVILDLLLIKFLDKFMNRPIHFFGGSGIISFLISFSLITIAFYYKITGQKDLVETPLLTISSMFFIVGILMILLGVMSEMLMRTYYESQNRFPFMIKEKINFDK